MAKLIALDVHPKAMTLPPVWGPDVSGRRGERLFIWRVGRRNVSGRYRATRHVTFTDASGNLYRALVDGVGGLLTDVSSRGRGYGAALMRASLKASKREGYALALLFCRSSLVKWYRRLGWWLTRDVAVRYQPRRGNAVALDAPKLWMGLLALSPQPAFSTLASVEIEGRLW